jgi:hypothetical protein
MKFRKDQDALQAGIESLKIQATAEQMDFTEAEWDAVIRKAVTAGPAEQPRRARFAFKPVFAYSLAALLVGAAVLIGIRRFPWLVPGVENIPVTASLSTGQPEIIQAIDPMIDPALLYAQAGVNGSARGELSSKPAAGDVPSFTWISQESGLQIVWFVNDNLKMED